MLSYRLTIIAFLLSLLTVTIHFHNSTPAASNSLFKLPVMPGVTVKTTQGNDQGDHKAANGSRYAFDFAVGQEKFVIAAAQAGTILDVNDTSTIQCSDANTESSPKQIPLPHCWTYANHVLIADDDGTTATLYMHLSPYSDNTKIPRMTPHEHVNQGDALGLAGTTGWSTGIHLHFQVETVPNDAWIKAHPTSWWWTNSVVTTFSNPEVWAKDTCLFTVSNGVPETNQCFAVSASLSKAPTSVPMPPTQTDCPSAVTARAAITKPLVLGKDQNVVYVKKVESPNNTPISSTLYRYDVTTSQTTQLLHVENADITNAQVSTNEQWVIFVTQVNGLPAIQMIRMDGQGLQTLYCMPPPQYSYEATILYLLLSPDQKQLAFATGLDQDQETFSLLDMTNGTVQTELKVQTPFTFYQPVMWLNDTELYVWRYPIAQSALFLLNTQNGSQQQESSLTNITSRLSVFDVSPDETTLFTGLCTVCGQGIFIGPSTISTQPATSNIQQLIYTTKGAIQGLLAAQNNILLFSIQSFSLSPDRPADTSQDGIWKIHTDGSGLTQLSNQARFAIDSHQDISNDGKWYLLSSNSSLLLASLNGGTPTQVASVTNAANTTLVAAGWTVI